MMKLEDNSEAVPPDIDAALTPVTLDDFISAHLGNKLMDLVRREWQKLVCNSFIQDGLFPCVTVERIVEAVLGWWLDTELYLENPVQNASHQRGVAAGYLMTGIKGVGKTTIMLGLKAFISQFGVRVKSAYVSYDVSKAKPSEFLTALTGAPVGILSSPRGSNAYDQWAATNKKAFMIFGDELHHLYDSTEYIPIVSEILCLGKARHGFGLIADSSACIRSLAFKEDHLDARHRGYPDLNNSVFKAIPLNPVRTRQELENVLRFKDRTANFDPGDVFCRTGGVGRYIDCYGKDTDLGIPDIIAIVADLEYASLIRAFVSLNMDITDPFELTGFSDAEAAKLSCGRPAQYLRKLQDMHILHRTLNGTWELLIPSYYEDLRNYFQVMPGRLQMLALETTLRGWQGFGSAEQVLKPLVLNHLIKLKKDHFGLAVNQFCGELSTSVLNGHSLDELCGKVWIPVPDIGLDSCLFIRSTTKGTVDVYTSQLKFGAFGKKITDGTSDASRHFGAIAQKAKVGWADLHNKMKSKFPKVKFVCKAFTLVTNKIVVKAVTDLEEVSIMPSSDPSRFSVYHQPDFNEDFDELLEACNIVIPTVVSSV
jgi:hypothetical protein